MNTKALNRIYRLIWSEVQQAWIAVAETTRGRGKQSGSLRSAALSVTATSLLLFGPLAHAAPTGGQVVSGSALITESGSTGQSTTTITQSSDKLSLGWQSFNVGKAETVNFVQPNASALAVNRIYDTRGSEILGRINANGQVWLINPNGVLFGQGAQINVGALVASTLDTSDATLGQASQHFGGNSTASVVNLGQINAAQGGYVALLGHSVINQGSLSAPGGTAAMGAGSAVSLSFAGSKLLGLQVEQNQLNALAANGGLIQADGGQVLLSAGARDSLLASVVNNTGIVQARTVQEQGGKIILLGGMAAGTTHVGGTLDASAPNGSDGGFIETSAHTVHVADSARITTASAKGKQGQWLIDPYDFVVAASGGNITGAALGAALNSNSVTIQTTDTGTSYAGTPTTGGTSGNGDIFVNDSVTWGSATTLTLYARRNININAPITASHDNGKLALLYGQRTALGYDKTDGDATYNIKAPINLKAGNNFSTKLGSNGSTVNYTVITALGSAGDENSAEAGNSLQGLAHKSRLRGKYVLGADIDASDTAGWNNGAGFVPIGADAPRSAPIDAPDVWSYRGVFDGLGHAIRNLTIDRPRADFVGLFGYTNTGGPNPIRNIGLIGGNIRGKTFVGGLVGYMQMGDIKNSYSTADVTGVQSVGGLVGSLGSETGVYDSYASGDVSGNSDVGGLVGTNFGRIATSYATGNVQGSGENIGGLLGHNAFGGINGGGVENSYATGNVEGQSKVGGLVGYNAGGEANAYETAFVTGSYATGNVIGAEKVGLLVGDTRHQDSIRKSYYFGDTYKDDENDRGTWTVNRDCSSCPDGWVTGQSGGSGLDFSDALKQSSYQDFDFTNTWYMVEGSTRPFLRMEHSTTVRNAHQLQLMGMDLSAKYTLANNIDMAAELSNPNGMWAGNSAGFAPIGSATDKFTGSFDGAGHTISKLTIQRADTDNVGLFGYTAGSDSLIRRVGLVDANVTGKDNVGSLVGHTEGGTISESYATGEVNGTTAVGGLVGYNDQGSINNSYATGEVNGTTAVGGLVGDNQGNIENSYFDKTTTGQEEGVGYGSATGVTGLSTDEMQQSGNFSGSEGSDGFNFDTTWFSYDGHTSPLLRNFLTTLTVTVNASGSKTYDGTTACTSGLGCEASYFDSLGKVFGEAVYALDSKNAGSRSATASGLYSDQQGYLIKYVQGGTATITQKEVTISGITAADKTYDGTVSATVDATKASGWIDGDQVSVSATGSFADKNAASGKTVTLSSSYSGADKDNYLITDQASTTADIAKAALTVSGITAANKTYDGTAGATVSSGAASYAGLVSGDQVSVSATGSFADKNAGSSKTVTLSSSYSGADKDNYLITGQASTTADIAKAALTVSGLTAANKTYDGTANATVSSGAASYAGLVSGDQVSVSATGVFADKNAESGKTVTLSSSYSGIDKDNYLFTDQVSTTATITPKQVTISGITAADKTYDGTVSAKVDATKASGWIDGDKVSVSASGSFDNKNASSAPKTVTLSSSYSGVDKDNYLFTDQGSTTASITPKALTIEGTSAAGKTYDGNTSAAITVGTLSGFVGKETVSASASGTFDSKDPGVRSATAKYTLADNAETGGQAANYQLADTTGLSATIEKAPVQKAAAEDATTGVDIKNTASWVDSQSKKSQQLRQAQFITATVAPVQITQPVLVRSTGVLVPDGAYQKESVALAPLDNPLSAFTLPSLRKFASEAGDKREP